MLMTKDRQKKKKKKNEKNNKLNNKMCRKNKTITHVASPAMMQYRKYEDVW